jgi:hypothetical protein
MNQIPSTKVLGYFSANGVFVANLASYFALLIFPLEIKAQTSNIKHS